MNRLNPQNVLQVAVPSLLVAYCAMGPHAMQKTYNREVFGDDFTYLSLNFPVNPRGLYPKMAESVSFTGTLSDKKGEHRIYGISTRSSSGEMKYFVESPTGRYQFAVPERDIACESFLKVDHLPTQGDWQTLQWRSGQCRRL